jgi:hypothetical protein
MIKIWDFINGWNDRCQPFVWTETRRPNPDKANRKQLQLRSTRFAGVENAGTVVEASETASRMISLWPHPANCPWTGLYQPVAWWTQKVKSIELYVDPI